MIPVNVAVLIVGIIVGYVIRVLHSRLFTTRVTRAQAAELDTAQSVLIEAVSDELDCEQHKAVIDRANQISEEKYECNSFEFSFKDD